MIFWIGCMIFIVLAICYACCVISGDSQKQSEEDFKAFLEEKERVKNG